MSGQRMISVAIATCNGEKYIGAQLESIDRQTTQPNMISISDDASTDRTLEIVEAFGTQSQIEIVIRKNTRRIGVIENFLQAFDGCTGDYIAYCDQDDLWRLDKVERYSKALLENENAALVFHRSVITDENLTGSGRVEPWNLPAGCYCFPHFPNHLWGYGHQMLFSTEVLLTLKRIRAADKSAHRIPECFDLTLLLAAGMVGDIVLLNENLVHFRRHQGSVSPAAKTEDLSFWKKTRNMRRGKIEANTRLMESVIAMLHARENGTCEWVSQRYVEHVESLLRQQEDRLSIYSESRWLSRQRILAKLIATHAYGSAFRNRLPLRQFLLDAAWCVV